MKQISLWAFTLSSVIFAIVVCLDQHRWDYFFCWLGAVAVWMFLGWFWIHRFDIEHDIKVLAKGDSPLKCRWIGTLVFFLSILLIAVVLIVWGLWWIGVLVIRLT